MARKKISKIVGAMAHFKRKVDALTDIRKKHDDDKKLVTDVPVKMEIDMVYVKATPHVPVLEKPHWLRRAKRKEWNKQQELLANKEKVALVRMEMNNGRFREFLINEKEGSFIFNDGRYVLDNEQKYYIIDRDIWAYDFHESIALPIRKKMLLTDEVKTLLDEVEMRSRKGLKAHIEANEIKKLIENSNLIDTEASLNPTTLKRFTDSEVIKQVLQGAMLGKIFKVMFILIIIIAVFELIGTIIDLYQSGVFEKISNALK